DIVETPKTAPVTQVSTTPLLSIAAEEWLEEKSRTSWVPKTANEHRVWMNHFMSLVGDRPLDTYTKADGRNFKAVLLNLPANWGKHNDLKGLSIKKHSNINKIMRFVGSFWNWADDNFDNAPSNPFKGLTITIKKKVREERHPFSISEIEAIFSTPIYTGCKSPNRWAQPGEMVLKDSGFYWVPLIAL
ncbi:tyrosine-type recombinase/integrase, partial [Aduncisulcus paluster]